MCSSAAGRRLFPGEVRQRARARRLVREADEYLARALEARTLRLHGWVYHFEKGEVDYYDPLCGKFQPVEQRVWAWVRCRYRFDREEDTR